MASEVDIANLALSHLGDDASVASFDPPEGSPQAEHCARFYPIARDSLLEMHAWTFATTTTTTALTPLGDATGAWLYGYALPSGCLRPLKIFQSGWAEDSWIDTFDVEARTEGQEIILANIDAAYLRYTRRVTDTSKFSPLFVDALSWLLASMLAGPVLKGESGAKAATSCFQVFLERFGRAAAADARRGRTRLDPVAPWMRARGIQAADRYLGNGLWRHVG